jgi:hypothetical protein
MRKVTERISDLSDTNDTATLLHSCYLFLMIFYIYIIPCIGVWQGVLGHHPCKGWEVYGERICRGKAMYAIMIERGIPIGLLGKPIGFYQGVDIQTVPIREYLILIYKSWIKCDYCAL